jgi:hypothetical protein
MIHSFSQMRLRGHDGAEQLPADQRNGREAETLGAAQSALDDEAVAGRRLAANDFAQVVGEVFQRREASGFCVEVAEVKAAAAFLAAMVKYSSRRSPLCHGNTRGAGAQFAETAAGSPRAVCRISGQCAERLPGQVRGETGPGEARWYRNQTWFELFSDVFNSCALRLT